MRTEEYIIILLGVVADNNNITITYTSESPQNNVTIRVEYSNGQTIKTFDHVKNATNGQLAFPVAGLMPGSYTCFITESGKVKDSKGFSIV